MEVEGEFLREQIENFLRNTTIESLSIVDTIYLLCNPKKPEMTRHVCLKSKEPIQGWNYEWDPIKNVDSPFAKLLSGSSAREKIVQKFYLDNKKQFPSMRTVGSQMRLEDATGIRGGSFLLRALTSQDAIRLNLAKAFLALAKALNQDDFDVDAIFCLSLRMYPRVYGDRVKLDMYTAVPLDKVLRNIQRLFQDGMDVDYNINYKTHVASYLTQLPEFEVRVGDPNKPSFEKAIKGTTSTIDELCDQLAMLNSNACLA